jgi:outer membrane protein assembly factor BamB
MNAAIKRSAFETETTRPDALEQYAARMRRNWVRYWLALCAVFAIISIGVVETYLSGELHHVSRHEAVAAAPPVARSQPASSLKTRWTTTDEVGAGSPIVGGAVVTYSAHTVTGRSVVDGTSLWSSTRRDRTLCSVSVLLGRAIAVYKHRRDCDQVEALDAGTGARVWQRTLDLDGRPIRGDASIAIGADAVYVYSQDTIYPMAISESMCNQPGDQGCGVSYWTYRSPDGCVLKAVVPGARGILISQQCESGLTFLFRDSTQSGSSSSDGVKWSVAANSSFPLISDPLVATYDYAAAKVNIYDPQTGKLLRKTRFTPDSSAREMASKVRVRQITVVTLGSRTYALDSAGKQLWTQASATSVAADALGGGTLYQIKGPDVVAIDPESGQLTHRYHLANADSNATVQRIGAGFLLCGKGTSFVS